MSFSNTAENAILALLFNATAWANMADNAASSPQTQIACALHTADPGEAGAMNTSEAAFTDYARQNINRNSGGWAVTNNSVSPVSEIAFPTSGAAGSTITHCSVGKTGGGAAAIHMRGTVTPNIAIGAAGITPKLTTATTFTLD